MKRARLCSFVRQRPSYKGFRGEIESMGEQRYAVSGKIAVLDASTVEISELPVKVWTQSYKENVLEPMLNNEKGPQLIT